MRSIFLFRHLFIGGRGHYNKNIAIVYVYKTSGKRSSNVLIQIEVTLYLVALGVDGGGDGLGEQVAEHIIVCYNHCMHKEPQWPKQIKYLLFSRLKMVQR